MRKKLTLAGVALIALAVLSGLAETLFYGGTDAEGVLQESLFLPLSFILAAVGVLVLAAAAFSKRRP